MFSTKTLEVDTLCKIPKLQLISQRQIFRKLTGNVASTENFLTVRLSKSSVFYAMWSIKAS